MTFSKLFFALYFSTTLSTVLNSHQIHAAYNRANTVDIPDLLVGYIFSYSFGTIFQVFFLPGFVFYCIIWLTCFCLFLSEFWQKSDIKKMSSQPHQNHSNFQPKFQKHSNPLLSSTLSVTAVKRCEVHNCQYRFYEFLIFSLSRSRQNLFPHWARENWKTILLFFCMCIDFDHVRDWWNA